MGKKAKASRKELYKGFLDGMISYRTKFIERKFSLLEKVLENETLKKKIMSKKRSEMSVLERAVVDTLENLNISTLEQFQEISEKMKETQEKTVKFKYTPKKI